MDLYDALRKGKASLKKIQWKLCPLFRSSLFEVSTEPKKAAKYFYIVDIEMRSNKCISTNRNH